MSSCCEGRSLLHSGASLAVALVLAVVVSGSATANPIPVWFFSDSAPPGWGAELPYWEHFSWTYGASGSVEDLDPDHPLCACTEPMTGNLSVWNYQTQIWFANIAPIPFQVVVELRKGSWGDEGTLVAADIVTVTNAEPAMVYASNFYVSATSLVLHNESLVIKIISLAPMRGFTRIYWNDLSHRSMLTQIGPLAVQPSTWGRIKALYHR